MRFAAVATTGTTTASAVFCFQDDNRHGQDGVRYTTNYCRRVFARRRYEQIAKRSFIVSSRYRDEPRDNFISHRLPGVHEFAYEPATARGRNEHRAKQAVEPRRMFGRLFFLPGGRCFGRLVRLLYLLFSVIRFFVFQSC